MSLQTSLTKLCWYRCAITGRNLLL